VTISTSKIFVHAWLIPTALNPTQFPPFCSHRTKHMREQSMSHHNTILPHPDKQINNWESNMFAHALRVKHVITINYTKIIIPRFAKNITLSFFPILSSHSHLPSILYSRVLHLKLSKSFSYSTLLLSHLVNPLYNLVIC